jgi:hypothetical protein
MEEMSTFRLLSRWEIAQLFRLLLDSGDLSFRHGDDADFEAELGFGQLVRRYARRREGLVPGTG